MGKSVYDEISEELDEINGEFAVEAITLLNAANPLDTGLSRSNWTMSLNSDTVVEFPIDSPSDVINNAKLFSEFTDLSKDFFIKNNIKYIVPLAHGSSKQAKRGWVDRSIIKAIVNTYGVT